MTAPDITPQNIDGPKPVAKPLSRQAQFRKVLRRKSGVSIAQLQQAFGWQPQTARAAISAQRKGGHPRRHPQTASATIKRVTAIQAKTERKREDRCVRRAEKRRCRAEMLQVQGPTCPISSVCAIEDTG